jgi:hypothetical protein
LSARHWQPFDPTLKTLVAHHALACVYLFARRFDDSLAEFDLALRTASTAPAKIKSVSSKYQEAVKARWRRLRHCPGDDQSLKSGK